MNDDRTVTYFSLGMASGFLVIVGSLFSVIWLSLPFNFMYAWMSRIMFGWGYGFSYHLASIGAYLGIALVGIISGVMILISSIMMYRSPSRSATWGAVLLVASITSFIAMGGFFVGALLGFVTGLLAILSRPSELLEQTRNI